MCVWVPMTFIDTKVLHEGAKELGIDLTDDQLALFDEFASLFVEANKTVNLTRITEPKKIVTDHFLDSLTVFSATKIKENADIVDVGTGAGFPGICIKIARPDVRLWLMDSVKKKLSAVDGFIQNLHLTDTKTVCMRAEDAGKKKNFRDSFDLVTARAVADVKVLAELCVPLARKSGKIVMPKSGDCKEELDHARAMIGQLGAQITNVHELQLPQTDMRRTLVVLEKKKATPDRFPRPYAKIVEKKDK